MRNPLFFLRGSTFDLFYQIGIWELVKGQLSYETRESLGLTAQKDVVNFPSEEIAARLSGSLS